MNDFEYCPSCGRKRDSDGNYCAGCGRSFRPLPVLYSGEAAAQIVEVPQEPPIVYVPRMHRTGSSMFVVALVVLFAAIGALGASATNLNVKGAYHNAYLLFVSPTPTATSTPTVTPTPTNTATPTVTPTPTMTPTPLPTSTPMVLGHERIGPVKIDPGRYTQFPLGILKAGTIVDATVQVRFNSSLSYIAGSPDIDIAIGGQVWTGQQDGVEIRWQAPADGSYWITLSNARAGFTAKIVTVDFNGN